MPSPPACRTPPLIAVKAKLVIPLCQQQLLSFRCDLEAGHDGFHHDGTTTLVRAYWPPKKPPKSQVRRKGETSLSPEGSGLGA